MGLRLLLFFFFLLSFLSFFSITQPSSAGRGPFASLARGQPSHRAFVTRSLSLSKGRTCSALLSSSRMRGSMLGFPSVFFRVLPWLMLLLSSFSFCLLMRVCLKTERLRWGSPTATAPFALRFCYPVPELVEGSALAPRFCHLRVYGDPCLAAYISGFPHSRE